MKTTLLSPRWLTNYILNANAGVTRLLQHNLKTHQRTWCNACNIVQAVHLAVKETSVLIELQGFLDFETVNGRMPEVVMK